MSGLGVGRRYWFEIIILLSGGLVSLIVACDLVVGGLGWVCLGFRSLLVSLWSRWVGWWQGRTRRGRGEWVSSISLHLLL